MSLIAIGDIHGCARTLDVLLERLAPAPDDHLVFIGDYIDRGPNSKRVIERLLALRDEVPCTFLRGNHEALMLEYLDYGLLRAWRANGGPATLQSYLNGRDNVDIPEAHIAFLKETRLHYDTPEFFFVHAGLKPHLTIAENLRRADDGVFLWERGHIDAEQVAWEKPVVCGHTPRPDVINRDKLIAIDTGCVFHRRPLLGKLTAARLPERAFVQVKYAG